MPAKRKRKRAKPKEAEPVLLHSSATVAALEMPTSSRMRKMLIDAALVDAKAPPLPRVAATAATTVASSAEERRLCGVMWGRYLAAARAVTDDLFAAAPPPQRRASAPVLSAEDVALLRRWRFSPDDELQLPCARAAAFTTLPLPAVAAVAVSAAFGGVAAGGTDGGAPGALKAEPKPPCWEVAASFAGAIVLRIPLAGAGVVVQLMRQGVRWELAMRWSSIGDVALVDHSHSTPPTAPTLRFTLLAPPSFGVESAFDGVRSMEPCGDFTTLDAGKRKRAGALRTIEIHAAGLYASALELQSIVDTMRRRCATRK